MSADWGDLGLLALGTMALLMIGFLVSSDLQSDHEFKMTCIELGHQWAAGACTSKP